MKGGKRERKDIEGIDNKNGKVRRGKIRGPRELNVSERMKREEGNDGHVNVRHFHTSRPIPPSSRSLVNHSLSSPNIHLKAVRERFSHWFSST